MTKTDFRTQIKELIIEKKTNIHRLALKTGLSYLTVYNYIRGKSEITSANLSKLFDVLNTM